MEIARNSVWIASEASAVENGLYRVLNIFSDVACLVLFPLDVTSATVKPFAVLIKHFVDDVTNIRIQPAVYSLPSYLMLSEEEIPENVRRQLSWPVRVNYDGRLGFLIFPTSSLF